MLDDGEDGSHVVLVVNVVETQRLLPFLHRDVGGLRVVQDLKILIFVKTNLFRLKFRISY